MWTGDSRSTCSNRRSPKQSDFSQAPPLVAPAILVRLLWHAHAAWHWFKVKLNPKQDRSPPADQVENDEMKRIQQQVGQEVPCDKAPREM
jgi:hypothetical protein